MHEIEDWVDVSGGEGGLVAVAVEAVVNVSGAGHDAAAAAAGNVAVVARCAVLGIGAVPAWVVHELALAAVANVCGVVWVVAVAAAVVGDAGDIGVGDVECVAAAATEVAGAVLGLLWGACACGFVIESASSFPMIETLSSSCARWLFDMASVSSGGLGDAAAIDGGGGGVSS